VFIAAAEHAGSSMRTCLAIPQAYKIACY
jgi:hypothetical protein